MKVKAVIANTRPFSFNFDKEAPRAFSLEDLQGMAETAIGVRVMTDYDQFKQVGTVVTAEVKDNELIVEMDIDDNTPDFSKVSMQYACPQWVPDTGRLTGVGIVEATVLQGLKPISLLAKKKVQENT